MKIFKKIIRWLYKRYIDEIYISEKVEFLIKEKDCFANVPEDSIQIVGNRGKAYHERYFWNGINGEINIFKKK